MTLLLLCLVAFLAGFTDAIAGGGGLIQTPAALVLLPQYPVATVIGTLKIPAFTGTSVATVQYAKRVKVNAFFLVLMTFVAFGAAYAGSTLLARVNNNFMKPLLLIILTAVAIYTYTNKNFGRHAKKNHGFFTELWYCLLISLIIG